VGGMFIAQGAMPNETGYVAAVLFAGGLMMWLLSYLQMNKKKAQLEQCSA
jgi:DHA1 family inner membrane transport protein